MYHSTELVLIRINAVLFASMSAEQMKNGLQTRFAIPRNVILDINSRYFFHGSCFSENVASLLQTAGFPVHSNPYGILYNPYSMALALEKIAGQTPYAETDLFYYEGQFISPDHHGLFRSASSANLINLIQQRNRQALSHIAQSDIAVLTFGTAWIWEFADSGRIAGNCHRLPSHMFVRRILSEEEAAFQIQKCIQYLRMMKQGIKIILTVSPVKHMKEGLVQNTLSKSRLISAIGSLIEKDEDLIYFPAFEILTEELRDHHFYSEDLAHPSAWTIRYIFRRFTETFMDEKGLHFLEKCNNYLKMLNHRLMDADENMRKKWHERLMAEREKLLNEFPEIKHPELVASPLLTT